MIYGNYLRDKYNNTAVKIADAEGVPCVMEYSKGKNLRNYEIYGNSVQNGTPSPDTPIEIQSVGDKTTNLFDVNNINLTVTSASSLKYLPKIENGIYYTGGKKGTASGAFPYICVEGINNVTLSFFNSGEALMGNIYQFDDIDENGIMVGHTTLDNLLNITEGYTKSYAVTKKYFGFLLYSQNRYGGILSNIQILEGTYTSSTKPEYEPYGYRVPIECRGRNLYSTDRFESFRSYKGFDLKYNTYYTVSIKLREGYSVPNECYAGFIMESVDGKVAAGWCIVNGVIQSPFARLNADPNKIYNNRLLFGFLIRNDTTIQQIDEAFEINLVEGSYTADTMPPYEPYHEPITTHIYLDEPLRKVGDYADYIDFKNQKVVRNIIKQSLNAFSIYKKLNSVIRIDGRNATIKHKFGSHILSTIFNYNLGYSADIESIFHHTGTYYNYYWSVYWNRLGLTYDGTNVYRIDDTSQTPLTNSEIISIAKEWLSTLSDKDKEVYMILDTPTEEPISLPSLKTVKGTSIMSIDTTIIQPSNIKAKYIRK